MSAAVILNGDQVYLDELVRENARLTVQVEVERQRRRELEAALARLKAEKESLSGGGEQLEAGVDSAEGKREQQADAVPEPMPVRIGSHRHSEEGAKGIVILYCESCGNSFATFLKERKQQFVCRCGGHIDLTRPMARFRYSCPCCEKKTWGSTNVEEPSIETKCLCGNPVVLAWNPRSKEYRG